MSNAQGKFVWYELMTTDPKAAEGFYSKVVGWNAQDANMPHMKYTMMKAGDDVVAGVMDIPQDAVAMGARPAWVGYVAVDDVDASAKKVTQTGGKVHREPTDIPNVGRFAIIGDPQGTMLALFAPAGEYSDSAANMEKPGHVGWHELYALDWEKDLAFYNGLFGWTKDQTFDMGPAMGMYQMFAPKGGKMIGGMMNKPKEVAAPFWGYYFNVDGVDAAAARVKSAGGQVIHGPSEVPGGSWIVQGMDPQGAFFALLAPKR